jgi:hypothetical protein
MNDSKQPQRSEARLAEMTWLSENEEWLNQEHPGEWLALEGSTLLAIGRELSEVLKEARSKGIENPFVSAVRSKKYQGVQMFR